MDIIYDETYTDHLRGVEHPESPDRVRAVVSHLVAEGLFEHPFTARDATDDELALVHPHAYIERVRRDVARLTAGAGYLSTGDTVITEASFDVAKRAAGGVLVAMERAVDERCGTFAIVRPPGHHAEPARGMGFCIFGNASIAARAFTERTGKKALIIDFDYHHGNGTQAASGTGVSYISTHGYPAYPGTGTPSENRLNEEAMIFNVPLSEHDFGTEPFLAVWERLLRMSAEAIRPDLLVVSAGYDFLEGDPVGDLGVEVEASRTLGRLTREIADQYCNGSAAFCLEGGYNLKQLARGVELTIRGFEEVGDPLGRAELASVPHFQRAMLGELDAWEH